MQGLDLVPQLLALNYQPPRLLYLPPEVESPISFMGCRIASLASLRNKTAHLEASLVQHQELTELQHASDKRNAGWA